MIDVVSIDKTTFADPPLKFEAGTPPIVQAIALGKAIDWINKYGIENIGNHEQKLISYAYDKLEKIDGVNIFGKNKKENVKEKSKTHNNKKNLKLDKNFRAYKVQGLSTIITTNSVPNRQNVAS